MKLTTLTVLAALALPNLLLAQQDPQPVTTAQPVVKSVVERDEFIGRFAAQDEVIILSRVSGLSAKSAFHRRLRGGKRCAAVHH